MKMYFKYVKPYLVFFIVGPILMLTEVAGDVILPSLTQKIIDNGITETPKTTADWHYVVTMSVIMVCIALVMLAGGVGGNYMAARSSASFAALLRADIYRKVQEFSFHNIDTFSTGSLVTRLTNDVTQLQNIVRMGLVMLLRAPGMMIGGIIMAFLYEPKLAGLIVAVIPVMAAVIFFMIKVAFPRYNIMQEKLDRLNTSIQESMTNVRLIKSFVREDFEKERFGKSNEDLMDSSLLASKVMILTMPLMTLCMNFATVLVVWFGGRMVMKTDMSVGTLSAFTTYIVQILMSFMFLSMIILQSSRAMASSRRIKEILNTQADLKDDGAKFPQKKVESGSVEFKNVSFKYYKDREEKVLDNINLDIKAGSTVGIIGSTGSGKSSLVQLIPRLYDADGGAVYVDGVNVKDYSFNNLRNGVSMVLQNNILFSGTIEDNLKWGDEKATQSEITEASVSAQADSFVKNLPDGYNTQLGQGGVNVSGGQKQRLCIARALLKKPKILILDDSTSAVDTATESRIRQAFKKSMPDVTKIIIAQRIGSVIEADQIVVMDEGKIVGIGRHTGLMESCEAYREIYASQNEQKISSVTA